MSKAVVLNDRFITLHDNPIISINYVKISPVDFVVGVCVWGGGLSLGKEHIRENIKKNLPLPFYI